MFSIHDFIMNTLGGMVGNYPEFQVREYALNWYGKGKLTEADLAAVEGWFAEEPAGEEITEDTETMPEAEEADGTTEE